MTSCHEYNAHELSKMHGPFLGSDELTLVLSTTLSSVLVIPQEGALQPVIGLLSSKCTESQREAALLLGQFATTTDDYKAKIVQRGAVPPLIAMLGQGDTQVWQECGCRGCRSCQEGYRQQNSTLTTVTS